MMTQCIQLDMECAAICYSAAQLMSMGSTRAEEVCRLCAELCTECAIECEKHPDTEHCAECARACRECAEQCNTMVGAMHH